MGPSDMEISIEVSPKMYVYEASLWAVTDGLLGG